MQNGIWFSFKNEGISGLIIGIIFSLMIFFIYLLEKRQSDDFYKTYFCAQLFSICEIGLLICAVFNLD